MAYSLELDRVTVLPYLRQYEGLSRRARVGLFSTLHEYLGEHGDRLRNDDSLRRWGNESPYFLFRLVIGDPEAPGVLKLFRFVVNDAAAAYGVLRVVYVDDQTAP